MYLNKTSSHPKEALDFLQFLTSVPGNQLFTDKSLWLPAINGVDVPDEIKPFRDYQLGYAIGQSPYNFIGSEVSMAWDSNFYELTGDQGSVDKFAAKLDQVMPQKIRMDLENEARNALLLVKPQDALIIAQANLVDESDEGLMHAQRWREMEAGQTMSEGLAFQMKLQLARSKLP